ncbi:hypothetical protein Phum_PHUM389260 [Pediculus humanus corporis]|uniref:EF-hand domain-containing protein n=1 Tax=Pediculus humanus subsp. corporis TaxID=121224 RepID=E0VQY5_PEDHC|nr:uncharacterized protein Phum_PHUM389260 [Pediculus humanus corporis]EEB15791.1 hypothetical protein Phum_PHUM389260 [Pediculus humanus corporis]
MKLTHSWLTRFSLKTAFTSLEAPQLNPTWAPPFDLLEKLFKLFDENRDGILVQEEWVEFLKLRLT